MRISYDDLVSSLSGSSPVEVAVPVPASNLGHELSEWDLVARVSPSSFSAVESELREHRGIVPSLRPKHDPRFP